MFVSTTLMAMVIAAQANASTQELPTLGEAMLTALEVCSSAGQDGTIEFGPSAMFQDFPAAVKQRMPSLKTFEDLPELHRRFAQTAVNSRMFGARAFTILGTDSGRVWLVETNDPYRCSIGVTGVKDQERLQPTIVEALQVSDVWQTDAENWTQGDVHWNGEARLKARPDGSTGTVKIQGLAPELSSADGIQVELNYTGTPAVP